MKTLFCGLLAATFCLGPSTNSFAQSDDPFGNATKDPFSGGNPFGGNPRSVQKKNAQNQAPAVAANAAPKTQMKGHAWNDAEARIRATLSDETTQSFIDTPLQDALMTIAKTHELPIVLDRRSLEEIGITPDIPVTIDLRKVSLRSFLRLMLRNLDLTYMVRDQVLQITTRERAAQSLAIKMYAVSPELTDKMDKIIAALTKTVQPQMWEALGGPCTVAPIDNVMAVSATDAIHDDIDDFLEKLKVAHAKFKHAKQ